MNRDVRKFNGSEAMTYWGNLQNNCGNVRGLLVLEDAKCGVWAQFFIDMLKV